MKFLTANNLLTLAHTHIETSDGSGVTAFLTEVVWHGLLDSLKLLPFLFLTYLLMEFIEYKAEDKAERFMQRAGFCAPVIGGFIGAVPQCGFSAAASNLYAGRVISVGTLLAVFLSTSDEMLPILISGNIEIGKILAILGYKAAVGALVGISADIIIKLILRKKQKINIDAICDNDSCHCEKGILHSAVHHTVTIFIFVFIVTLIINALVFFIGEDTLAGIMYDKPVISHLIAAVFGLVPNCAASVVLATLFGDGLITAGTMMSGLFSGAGVGLLVLYKVNKNLKENILITLCLVLIGTLFGILGDLIILI